MPQSRQQVLFLCTGNYYRSRFAEELFNHIAFQHKLLWCATSRGLYYSFPHPNNEGTISTHTLKHLHKLGITPLEPTRKPSRVTEEDLLKASRIIAIDESEHRTIIESDFSAWCTEIEYWSIHDLDRSTIIEALTALEQAVKKLIDSLDSSET